jgi:hypothetical protein
MPWANPAAKDMQPLGSTAARVADPTLDHLVVMASSLMEGVAWCEATLGVTPGPGGEHPLMGTHNRLLKIATSEFPTAYLEIIAINPVASPSISTRAKRWFDMDDPALRARIVQQGPTLVHAVVSVPDVHAAVAALGVQGLERGEVLQASRHTSHGLLQWHITVRTDGQRLFDGCLPTLIQWGPTHPTDHMPASGVTLHSLNVQHPQADTLRAAYLVLGWTAQVVAAGAPRLSAILQTPKGLIEIHT